ncbi:MAG: PIN domain-containing protein [Deltaproteobacteria bacterium]|nr:PIN domain-containing protein [Deltaproteobacteria bacterium]
MSGDLYLFDSVIIIDHLNGIDAATEFMRAAGEGAAVSAITRAEVLAGCSATDEKDTRAFLDTFEQIPVDNDVAGLAARFRRDHRLKLPDAIQAAAAILHGMKLATRNTRDFRPERFPFVHVPYEI